MNMAIDRVLGDILTVLYITAFDNPSSQSRGILYNILNY